MSLLDEVVGRYGYAIPELLVVRTSNPDVLEGQTDVPGVGTCAVRFVRDGADLDLHLVRPRPFHPLRRHDGLVAMEAIEADLGIGTHVDPALHGYVWMTLGEHALSDVLDALAHALRTYDADLTVVESADAEPATLPEQLERARVAGVDGDPVRARYLLDQAASQFPEQARLAYQISGDVFTHLDLPDLAAWCFARADAAGSERAR